MMHAQKILVVEDEPDLREILVYHFKREGFTVFESGNGEECLQIVRRENPSVLLLDLMLPGLSGLQVCRMLKAQPQATGLSIIMISALTSEEDILRGLELGADDYVRKPFKPKEVVARVRTVLRRLRPAGNETAEEILHFAPLILNQARHEVTLEGQPVAFTATEYRLLTVLMSQPERVFGRSQLLRQISDFRSGVVGRNVDVHIRSIRRKLGQHAPMIDTSRGVGYRFLPLGSTDTSAFPAE